uniref:Putative secreted protein n=1 Tax=Amblyomma triste TaxID=251400 RepID=A0A023G363_AMBTT
MTAYTIALLQSLLELSWHNNRMGLTVWALILIALLNLECSLAQPDGDNITAEQRGLWYVMHDHNQAMETMLTESTMYVLEVTNKAEKVATCYKSDYKEELKADWIQRTLHRPTLHNSEPPVDIFVSYGIPHSTVIIKNTAGLAPVSEEGVEKESAQTNFEQFGDIYSVSHADHYCLFLDKIWCKEGQHHYKRMLWLIPTADDGEKKTCVDRFLQTAGVKNSELASVNSDCKTYLGIEN